MSSPVTLLATVRYTQRGCPPSDAPPPYTVEQHVADVVRLLDALGIERAWAIGHSWGGYLALQLAVDRSDRLLGVISIDGLGVDPSVFAEQDVALRRGLSPEQVARVEAVEAARRRREATEEDLLERQHLLWPQWFAAQVVVQPPERIGARASTDVNASLREHFSRGTLARALPSVRLPVLFVHGELDPVPVRSSTSTAALVPGAAVEVIRGCGHFPWAERPGELRRRVEGFLAGLR